MVHIVFYEKPGCKNNTRQKALLAAAGHEVEARNLLTESWRPETLRPFFGNLPVDLWVNKTAPSIKNGQMHLEDLTEENLLAAMVADPLLIRRPLMQVGEERRVGFDTDQVDRWIGLAMDGPEDVETCRQSSEHHCPTPESASVSKRDGP